MTARIPNFRGQRILVLHREDRNREAICEQLKRLGTFVSALWPVEAISADEVDVVFFDSDMGYSQLFGWRPGEAKIPLVAVIGSEAPGRIEWMLAQEPSAYLVKPIGSTGVFSALSIAYHNFSRRRARDKALRELDERLQMRGVVLRAAMMLMTRHEIDDEQALRWLRTESMRRRLSLEAMSLLVLDGKWLSVGEAVTNPGAAPGNRRM